MGRLFQLYHLQYSSHEAGTIAKINQSKSLISLQSSWVFPPSPAHSTARGMGSSLRLGRMLSAFKRPQQGMLWRDEEAEVSFLAFSK